MSVLRDIRKKQDFKAVTTQLNKALKSRGTFNLAILQEELSRALGARNFHAFLAMEDQGETAVVSGVLSPYWQEAKASWSIFSSDCPRLGKVYLHGTPGEWCYRTEIEDDLFVMKRTNAEILLPSIPLPSGCTEGRVELVEFAKALPLLFKLLAAENGEALRTLLDEVMVGDADWSECAYLGLDRDAYRHEAAEGNTQLGYYDWLFSQLEQWHDGRLFV